MLFNLQVLRGLAALGVVFYHTDFRLAGDWHTDFSGVAIFFAISGFIMCFITRQDADHFLTKRFIRIVPMYWLCTLVVLIAVGYKLGLLGLSTWITTLATDLPRSLIFLPSEKTPLLGVGWTLNFEIYFASSWNRVGRFGLVLRLCLLRSHPFVRSAPSFRPDLRAPRAGARSGSQGWPVFGPPRQRREASLTAASTTA